MAQPAEPIVSVGEVPSRAPAQATFCWLIGAISRVVRADARSGFASAIVRAMAATKMAARRPTVRRGNFKGRGASRCQADKRGPSCRALRAQANARDDPRWQGAGGLNAWAGPRP